jgi:exosortase
MVGCAALGLLAWVYVPTLTMLAHAWVHNPRYSHGWLVPLFAVYLLWFRRARLRTAGSWESSWWGLPVLLAGLALHGTGTYFYIDWFNAASLPLSLAGLVILLGGWPALRWAWPTAAFLFFMAPLPYVLEVALGYPLQRLATIVSTYTLQTLGFLAVAEGNVIRLGEVHIGVAEACSGLGMLVLFVALAVAVVLLVHRPWFEKLLIAVSAVPIALLVNIVRITATGVLHKTVDSAWADYVFHDLSGWLMMPLALALLWAELRLLDWLRVPVMEQVTSQCLKSVVNSPQPHAALGDTPAGLSLEALLHCPQPQAIAADTPAGLSLEAVLHCPQPQAIAADTPVGLSLQSVLNSPQPQAITADAPAGLSLKAVLNSPQPLADAAGTPAGLSLKAVLNCPQPPADEDDEPAGLLETIAQGLGLSRSGRDEKVPASGRKS